MYNSEKQWEISYRLEYIEPEEDTFKMSKATLPTQTEAKAELMKLKPNLSNSPHLIKITGAIGIDLIRRNENLS